MRTLVFAAAVLLFSPALVAQDHIAVRQANAKAKMEQAQAQSKAKAASLDRFVKWKRSQAKSPEAAPGKLSIIEALKQRPGARSKAKQIYQQMLESRGKPAAGPAAAAPGKGRADGAPAAPQKAKSKAKGKDKVKPQAKPRG